PAKLLASYLPVLSLKGVDIQKGTDKINLRKGLIVFQFTISLVFIIGTLVIGKQIKFMTGADKGFNTDAIITINNWNDHEGKLKVFAENIKHLPGVANTILQGAAPMGFAQKIDNYKYKGKEELSFQVLADMGNKDFIPFYKMKLIAGRNMLGSDSLSEVVINETFSKALGITIFISCMGLFGLGMFTAERRTKEIGIRKVLGASVTEIAAMLSKDFVILVLIAIVIASPVAWYFMNQWLQDFVYRTQISWWV